MFLLPRLKVPRAIRFGDVEIAPFDIAISNGDPLAPSARKVLESYRKLGGAPAEGSLMWPVNRSPSSVAMTDDRILFRHRDALSMGLIAMNEYYRNVASSNVTDAHCDGILHPLTADLTHLAFHKRRREGFYGDAFPIEQLKTTTPLAASVEPTLRIDEDLLGAVAVALGRSDPLAERLIGAIPAFLQGSRLAETTAVIDDIVWMASAFERLLAATQPVGKNLSLTIAAAFSAYPHGATSWPYTSMSGNITTEYGPWVQSWMREYYTVRSSLHRGISVRGTWSELNHSVIAAEVFSLLVKLELDTAGLRSLTEDDECAAEALDTRIERLATAPGHPIEAWWEPFDAARRNRTVTSMAAAVAAAMPLPPTSMTSTPSAAATGTSAAEDGEDSTDTGP